MSDHANPTETKPRRKRGWLVPIGIIVIAGLLLANVLLQLRPDQPAAAPANESAESSAAPTEAPDLTVYEYRDANDVHAAGPVDAPVGLIVFSDYQCQFCAKWTTQTLPVMLEFAEAGDLRIEWRDINMYGEASDRAARAAHAAGLQSKFWEFHTALYPDGNHRTEAELSQEALIATAAELGLDAERFVADMNSPAVAQLIATRAAEAQQLGVTGTPSFLLNGLPIVGAQPTDMFVNAIETALDTAQKG
tara:strand:+ start:16092 stop:16838 length:747 start_codon:yes stop_codon:yes gene_type:complete